MMTNPNQLKIAIAQIAPVWLQKEKTIQKIVTSIKEAGKNKCELIVFGESLLPGYPFWLSLTNGSEFENQMQKEIYAYYIRNAVQIEEGDLDLICSLAKDYKIAVYLGITERAKNRGNHSLYCSLVYISKKGKIKSVHRKLQPTFEERLVWASGDGNGLKTHKLKTFCLGGLNCWENWMPLSRTALYGLGENVHIAVWPGSDYNTKDITRFIAKESRSYVISVGSIMRKTDFPEDTPYLDEILKTSPEFLANGGSCISDPKGNWLVAPTINKEKVIISTINLQMILEERQNFDVSGHYSRPDITKLTINRKRQSIIKIK